MSRTVLLTGVSGYIGLHCAQQLLNAGYIVRGSVRNEAKANSVKETLSAAKDEGYKGPSTRIAPNFMLRLISLFDREAKGMLGFLDMNIHADNSQTRTVFNWAPRSLRESVLDSARAVKAITG